LSTDFDSFLETPVQNSAGSESKAVNQFSDWYTGTQDAAQLGFAVDQGLKKSPDVAARVFRLATKTGLPQDLLERNLDEVERLSKRSDFDPNKFRQESPIVAAWLAENPNNSALAQEDFTKLWYIERQFRHIGSQFRQGVDTMKLVGIGEKAFLGTATPEDRKEQTTLEGETQKEAVEQRNLGITGYGEQIPGAMANQLPIFAQTIGGKAAGAVVGGMAGGLAGLAGGLIGGPFAGATAVGGTVAGGTFGWHWGAMAAAARMEGALGYLDFEKIRDANGNPLSREAMIGASMVTGVVNGALEMIALEKVMQGFPGFRALKRDAIREALKSPTAANAFALYGKRMIESGLTEGFTEGLQELVKTAAGNTAKVLQDDSAKTMTGMELMQTIIPPAAWDQALLEARAGSQAGIGMTGAHASVFGGDSLRADLNRAKEAGQRAQAFKELGNKSKELTSLSKSPEQTQQVMGRLADANNTRELYTPIDAWNSYWVEKGVDPREIAKEITGDTKSYDESVKTGADLVIPTERYAVTIAPTEHNNFFFERIKTDPSQISQAEVKDIIKQQVQAIESEGKQQQQQQEPTQQQQQQQVTTPEQLSPETIQQQLVAAGYSESDAQHAVTVMQGLQRLGERLGPQGQEFLNQIRLKITQGNKPQGETPPQTGEGGQTLFQGKPEAQQLNVTPEAKAALERQKQLGFSSQLAKEIELMDFKSIPAKDLANRIKNIQGIKSEELEFSGLQEYLQLKEAAGQKVTKPEIEQFIANNGVKIDQVVLSEELGSGTMESLEWTEPERDYSVDDDSIENEAQYYLKESDLAEEQKIKILKELEEEGVTDPNKIASELNERLNTWAYNAAEEDVNSDEYYGAVFVVRETNSDWTLSGNDEQGWWSSQAEYHFETSLEEAKIRLASIMIEKGVIEGDKAKLVLEKNVELRLPIGHKPKFETLKRKTSALFKANEQRFLKASKNDAAWWGDDKPTQKQLLERAKSLAEKEVKESYDNPNNSKNKIEVSIQHPLLSATVLGNNVKGYRLEYYNVIKDKSRREEQKPSSFKTVQLESKTPETAGKEAIQVLIRKGLITPDNPAPETVRDINAPTGETEWKSYSVKGAVNYREFLITLPSTQGGQFEYRTHFKEPNVLAFVRVSDRKNSNGEKTLFIEELQSDWHQQGREKGYQGKEFQDLKEASRSAEARAQDLRSDWLSAQEVLNKHLIEMFPNENLDDVSLILWRQGKDAPSFEQERGREKLGTTDYEKLVNNEKAQEYLKAVKDAAAKYDQATIESSRARDAFSDVVNAVPNAPFKATDAWATLALKRIFRLAAEQGYSALAWTPSGVHVSRWGTDSVGWVKKEGTHRKFVVSHDVEKFAYVVLPEDQPYGKAVEDGTFRYGATIPEEIAKTAAKEMALKLSAEEESPYFLVGAVEQRGGQAEGINIEEEARRRGLLLERNGERVRTKEELHSVIAGTLSRDRGPRAIESITESVWKQMQQGIESGSKFPRKEGMEFFYDNLLPRKVIPAILKKLDPKAKIEKTEIKTGSGYSTGEMSVLSVQITEEMKKKIGEGFTLFQPSDFGPRGAIHFGNKSFNIELLKNANKSTFFHETGHFYLEVLKDAAALENAQPQIKQDWNTVLDWLGGEAGKPLTTEQHEQFARGFEAYLMEGKAPSEGLRQAFYRFKRWLTEIYKDLRALNVQLTDEVRDVFDRLLATEEEIAAVRKSQNVEPLFPDPASVGMSAKDALKYSQAVQQSKDSARAELEHKAMAQVVREEAKQWKQRYKDTRAQVSDQLSSDPLYVALSVLQKGKLPNGAEVSAELSTLKLSRRAILDEYGKQTLDALPRPYVYSREGGFHPNFVAEMFGFKSGDELLKKLAQAENVDNRIERLTKEQLKAKYGDMMTDGTLRAEAEKAVNNVSQSQVFKKELDHLVSDEFAAFKGLVKKIARSVPTVEAIRNEAQDAINQKTIRSISPIFYQRAAAKAGKTALDALLKGDIATAFKEKEKQLVSHEMYLAAVDAQEQSQSIAAYLSRFNDNAVRARIGKAGGEYLNQIDALLEPNEFRNVSLKKLDKRKSLLAWVKEQQDQGELIDIPQSLLDEAKQKNFKEMTFQELKDLNEMVRQIEHLSKLQNKLLSAQFKRDYAETKREILGSLAANNDLTAPPLDRNPGIMAKLKSNILKGVASHTRMEFLFKWLDGFKDLGPLWRNLFKPLADAENAENLMQAEYIKTMRDNLKPYTQDEIAEWSTKKIYIESINENLTKAQILSIALNMGNAYNKGALMDGEHWSEAQVNDIVSNLELRDQEFLNKTWAMLETFWPAIAAQEKELRGLVPEKVPADPFKIRSKNGEVLELTGGYYPISFDEKRSAKASDRNAQAIEQQLFGGNWTRAMTKKGHTIERVGTGGQPLKLDLNVLMNHISSVAHDLTHRKAVIDVGRLLNDPQIRSAIEVAAGKEMYQELRPWLKYVANDRLVNEADRYSAILAKARGGVTVAFLGYKFVSALIQTTGYVVTVKEIGSEYSLKAMRDVYGSFSPAKVKEQWQFAADRSPLMKFRLTNFDRDVKEFARKNALSDVMDLGHLTKLNLQMQPVKDSFLYMIGAMDLAVSLPTWMGAYAKAMDGHIQNIEMGNEKDAIDYADSIVRRSQAAGGAKDLAAVQKGSQAWKLFTMFYSYMSLLFNQYEEATKQYLSDKNKLELLRTISLVWFSQVVVEEIFRGNMPGPDDDMDKWAKRFGTKMLFYPASSVVIVRDIANRLEKQLAGQAGHGKSFQMTPAEAAIEAWIGMASTGVKAATGDRITRKEEKEFIEGLGYLTGTPTPQIFKTSEYLYDWLISGDEQPGSVPEGVWKSLVTGKKPNK